jgi:tripeptidyl-peptidase-1
MKSMSDSSSIFTSGGGFSNVFAVPWYQRNATAHYLAKEEIALNNISNRFSPNGRGIPDVSAAAENFVVYMDGGAEGGGRHLSSCPSLCERGRQAQRRPPQCWEEDS